MSQANAKPLKRIIQAVFLISALVTARIDTSDPFNTQTLPTAHAQSPDPNTIFQPAPTVGTCTRCGTWRWTNAEGLACQTFTCLGPGWPSCANQTPRNQLCSPGNAVSVTSCGVTGVETCTYTCNAQGTGYGVPTCQQIGNGGNFRRNYCDYNAGCAVNNGFVEGKPTTIAELCTQDGVQQTITRGVCGAGGCSRRLVCQPGQPCCRPGIDPACTPQCQSHGEVIDIMPKCGPGGAGYQCNYGKVAVSVPLPCPSVQRKSFPRAIVGQPVQLSIVNGCVDLPSASNRVDVGPPYDDCGNQIFAYEGQLSWMCARPDQSDAQWAMDERPWNIGQRNALGEIAANRTGASIRHIYETSSFDLAPVGPGYPDPLKRQPAYQVQLTTHYALVGSFKYHYRTQVDTCYDGNGSETWCIDKYTCEHDLQPHPHCKDIAVRAKKWISPTREAPPVVIPDITVLGAKTPQDLGNPNTCGPIAIPVIQAQSNIVP